MKFGLLDAFGVGPGGVGGDGHACLEPAIAQRLFPGGAGSPGAVAFFKRHLPPPVLLLPMLTLELL